MLPLAAMRSGRISPNSYISNKSVVCESLRLRMHNAQQQQRKQQTTNIALNGIQQSFELCSANICVRNSISIRLESLISSNFIAFVRIWSGWHPAECAVHVPGCIFHVLASSLIQLRLSLFQSAALHVFHFVFRLSVLFPRFHVSKIPNQLLVKPKYLSRRLWLCCQTSFFPTQPTLIAHIHR